MKALSLGLTTLVGLLIPQLVLADEITTREGKTYHAAMVERVEPDGIILSYKPTGGGLGNAKLKFAILPENLQREYGYDPHKAAAFETDQVQAQQELQQKLWSEYEDATNRLAMIRIEEEKLAEIEAAENARKAQAEQERIAQEAKMKEEIESAKNRDGTAPQQNIDPYYLPIVYGWDPTYGYSPLQYQPPVNGMYRPPIPLSQVPPSPPSPAKK